MKAVTSSRSNGSAAPAPSSREPSPNLENVIEELDHEAAALTRLNRTDEARAVEERIKSVRKTAAEIPSISHNGDAPLELTEGAC